MHQAPRQQGCADSPPAAAPSRKPRWIAWAIVRRQREMTTSQVLAGRHHVRSGRDDRQCRHGDCVPHLGPGQLEHLARSGPGSAFGWPRTAAELRPTPQSTDAYAGRTLAPGPSATEPPPAGMNPRQVAYLSSRHGASEATRNMLVCDIATPEDREATSARLLACAPGMDRGSRVAGVVSGDPVRRRRDHRNRARQPHGRSDHRGPGGCSPMIVGSCLWESRAGPALGPAVNRRDRYGIV